MRTEGDPARVTAALQQAERDGVPLFLPGLVSDWPACRNGPGEGPDTALRHLAARMQGQQVTVMWSEGEVFVGKIDQLQPATMSAEALFEEAGRAAAGLPGPHLYLAQHTLTPDSGVLLDAPRPNCLSDRPLTSTNLWMCIRGSRSNIHYDPYANLLAVAVGSKKVTLWPSSATPYLYPAPLAGDATNHSCVEFAHPDFEAQPLYRHAQSLSQCVTLQAGDALFIPDGYWHQVDSTGITIAINFWWTSALHQVLAAQPHQTYAALRFTAAEALGSMLQQLLDMVPRADLSSGGGGAQQAQHSEAAGQHQLPGPPTHGALLHQLTTREQAALAQLHQHLQGAWMGLTGGAATNGHGLGTDSSLAPPDDKMPPVADRCRSVCSAALAFRGVETVSWQLGSDPVSEVLSALTAAEVVRVMYVLSGSVPPLVGHMLCGGLSPLAAYLFTTRLEEAQEQSVFCEQQVDTQQQEATPGLHGTNAPPDHCSLSSMTSQQFYETLYSTVEDPDMVFKELLAKRQQLLGQVKQRLVELVLR